MFLGETVELFSHFNPSKAGFFEGDLFFRFNLTLLLFIFQEKLIQ